MAGCGAAWLGRGAARTALVRAVRAHVHGALGVDAAEAAAAACLLAHGGLADLQAEGQEYHGSFKAENDWNRQELI